MNRIRKTWPAVVALAGAATVLPLLPSPTAQADGTPVAPAQINPTSGDSTTDFTLELPLGAACTGDSANDGFRVTSYMVRGDVEPAQLQFDSLTGPIPNDVGESFSQPLYTSTGNPYTAIQTANATDPGGPGPIINIPTFDLSTQGFQPGHIAPGDYNIGIACILGPPSETQLHEFWNERITITTDPSGGPAQVTFVEAEEPDTEAPEAPTVSITDPITADNQTAVEVGGTGEEGASVAISVDDANPATPAVTASTSVTGGAYGSTLDVSGLDEGTVTATVTLTDAAGNESAPGTATATKDAIDDEAPDAPTVSITDPITLANQAAVTVSGTGEAGATASISVDDADAATAPVTATVEVGPNGDYSATLDLTSLSDGPITATVTLTDGAENTSAPGSDTATKDTVEEPPAADPITGLLNAVVKLVQDLLGALGGLRL